MNDREIIAEFVIESREHLGDIENQLLAIEAAGADADPELVNTVFRAIHSVKGAAGFLGFSIVGQLAHDLENVLNLIRNGQLIPDAVATDVMLRSADRLRSMIEDIDHSNEADVSEHIDALQRIVAAILAAEIPAPTAGVALPGLEAVAAVIAGGEAIVPTPKRGADDFGGDVETPAEPCVIESEPIASETPPVAPLLPAPGARPTLTPATAPAPSATSAISSDSSIRVGVTVLDRLMNLAGELVLSRNRLLQTIAAADTTAVNSVAARINQVTSELQEAIMQTRLQPIGTVFGRFPRVVRDLSNNLGKQCQLTMDGQEVELDKSIIESVGDPLTHLIRNAVDHGVETPDARIKAGKSPVGTLALRAFHQSGKVNIRISDDGRGIDAARIKEKAVAKGIVTPEQARAMSDREALQLIFRPGFSLAERVTEVSGRGVGMDVVKTNIERLGGTVTIDTQPGAGATVHVKLPLTLAIIPSLVVRCAEQRFAIPQGSIRELVRVPAADAARGVERINQAEVFRLRDALLPLIRLDAALGLRRTAAETSRALHIIVVEAGHLRYGLVVDGLCDSEEIVVKPLGRHMKGCACLAGATILGDGAVAMILDVTGIAAQCRLAIPEETAANGEHTRSETVEGQSLLLFTNHPGEYFGLPMQLVARIERVRAEQVDSVGGQLVLQYRGGTLPLLGLEQLIACKPRPQTPKLYVVVFTAAQREVGLLIPELIDIRSVPLKVDTTTFREQGVVGSLVYESMTIRLLDAYELTRKAHPDWFATTTWQANAAVDQGSAAPDATAGVPRILLAEDSDFFRRQLASMLEADGYEVRACEDGAAAWVALQDAEEAFDLLVTDIEMPNMTGLQLAARIRGDSRHGALPIIAVTSLAGDDDVARGQDSGVDEYLVKLDREQLLTAVGARLKASGRSQRG